MQEELQELAQVNAEVIETDWLTEDDIINAVKDADAILTDVAKMTRRVMESLTRCRVIVSYGIGYNHIDVAAATDNSILVVNVPDYCLEEVSNHAILLLLACAKNLISMNAGTKSGRWAECEQAQAPMGSIYGQKLGIVGCGQIGRLTARKAQCFGLKVMGYDPYVDKSLAAEYGINLVSLPELLKEADYVSLHTLLNQETWHLIGEKELRQMKPSAYLINVSRGSVIDETALIKALKGKWLAGAGLDVFEKEPVDRDNPLLKMENVIVTPHSAYYSEASLKRLRTSVGQETARVLSGKWPRNVVNKGVKPKVDLT
jgi:D-3-phosphoglycerate dehydrogenase